MTPWPVWSAKKSRQIGRRETKLQGRRRTFYVRRAGHACSIPIGMTRSSRLQWRRLLCMLKIGQSRSLVELQSINWTDHVNAFCNVVKRYEKQTFSFSPQIALITAKHF